MKLLSLCLLSAGLALAICGKLVGTVFVLAALVAALLRFSDPK